MVNMYMAMNGRKSRKDNDAGFAQHPSSLFDELLQYLFSEILKKKYIFKNACLALLAGENSAFVLFCDGFLQYWSGRQREQQPLQKRKILFGLVQRHDRRGNIMLLFCDGFLQCWE